MSSELEELRRQLADAHQRLSKTNLPTFLDGLHKHLFSASRSNRTRPSRRVEIPQTRPTNFPRYLRAWDTFTSEQEEIWRLLMDSSLVEDKFFTSLHILEEMGENVRRLIGSELDLNHFLRQTVEDHISKIIEELYKDPVLRQTFDLRGSIQFENHSNTLSLEQGIVEGLQSVDIRGRPTRRRSPHLAEREERASSAATRKLKTSPLVPTRRPCAD